MDNSLEIFELDELYWFINRKGSSETRENVYVITMVRRNPRQIVGYSVTTEKTSANIQEIVDSGPQASKYCTDGYNSYLDVIFPGEHIRNINNKNDTFTVEGVNADLRHFIPLLRRRSRCFARSLETLSAVIDMFVDSYNRFGLAKYKYRLVYQDRSPPFGFVDFLFVR